MKWYHSVVCRITGLTFLLLAVTIGLLIFLVNVQMGALFSDYLTMHAMPLQAAGGAEGHFMSSVHESLLWVGLFMAALSMVVSYLAARNIARPLCQLNAMAEELKEGKLGASVDIRRRDEVGRLARTINAMSIRLSENECMRRRLFANIAHELRTPLAVIQGNLEGMMDDVVPMDKKTILSLEEEVLRLNRLVQDLRDLSLAEVNALELHKRPCDLNLMLRRAVSVMQPLIEEKSITVELSLAPDVPAIAADSDRINQVIYNLLSNAVRYIPEGRSIRISTALAARKGRRFLDLAIADTGDGIDPADLPYIFQCFYRGEKSRCRQLGGSGIGLALAQQFVLAHGGTIRAESAARKGTVFYISLPYDT